MIDRWDDDEAPPPAPPEGGSGKKGGRGKSRKGGKKKDQPKLMYPSLEKWLEEHFSPLIRRNVADSSPNHWCPQWWKHAEAVSRLTALWRAWEHLRLEPALGMSLWWLHHCDPHLDRLLSPAGPFAKCKGVHGDRVHGPLPVSGSDPGLWRGAAFSGPDDPARPDGEGEVGEADDEGQQPRQAVE